MVVDMMADMMVDMMTDMVVDMMVRPPGSAHRGDDQDQGDGPRLRVVVTGLPMDLRIKKAWVEKLGAMKPTAATTQVRAQQREVAVMMVEETL